MAANNVEEIDVVLSEPQEAVMAARTRLILDMAGQGGGKSQNIGYSSGLFASTFPRLKQFLGANTYDQLSGATLSNAYKVWRLVYGMTEYDAKSNPRGNYVVDKKPPLHFQKFSTYKSYKNIISFWNGAQIMVGSLDNYKAHDGKEFALAHLDETKDTKEEALKEVILGRLRQVGLWFNQDDEIIVDFEITAAEAAAQGLTAWNPLYIHTSPAHGVVEWLNTMFQLNEHEEEIKERLLRKELDYFYKETDTTTAVIYSAFHNQDNLPPNYLENQLKTLNEEQGLKLVYGFPFSKTGGEWFDEFSRLRHVGEVPHLPHIQTIDTSWDFNAVPYMTCLLVQFNPVTRYLDAQGNKHFLPEPGYMPLEVTQIRFFKEYCFGGKRNSIDAIGEQFAADFSPDTTEINYYGDAQGNNRIEGLGTLTRFKVIEDAFWAYTHSSSKKQRGSNVNPMMRRDLMNDIFAGRIPELEIMIDSSCKELIKDCDKVKVDAKGKVKPRETTEELGSHETLGHTSDAAEYIVSEAFKEYIKQKHKKAA